MSDSGRNGRRAAPRGPLTVISDPFYSTLRLIARHVSGFFGALAAFLTVGFIVAAAAVVVFVAVASAVRTGLTQQFDEATLRWLAEHRAPLMDQVMLDITALGTGLAPLMIVAVASVFLWLTQHRWSVYVLLLGVLGGKLINTLLKAIFDRDRPSVVEWIADVRSPSFPSGHAMSAMVLYGSIAYLVARLEPTPRLRWVTWLFAGFMILAMGFSRMYVGVHYPSDVIAGFIAGLAWLTFVASTVSAIRFFANRRPETHQEEHDLKN
jgi:undecaprenyl-diphosphatase